MSALKSLILTANSALGERAAKEFNKMRDEHKFMSVQIDELNTEMPCGHLQRFAENRQGARVCLKCLCSEQVQNNELFKTIKNAVVLLEDDHIEAAMTILQLKIGMVQS